MLLIGKSAWSDFLSVVTAKRFLPLDVVLIFIRVALVGSGIAVDRERVMLWVGIAVGTPVLVYAGAPRLRAT